MNINTSIQSTQPVSSCHQLTGATLAAESTGRKVSQHAQKENHLRKDIELFTEVAGRGIPDRNIMVSPLLVSKAENITAMLRVKTGLDEHAMSKEANRSAIDTTDSIHVLSKRQYVDASLERLKISHTTSEELAKQGYAAATRQLNDLIAKDTHGMITDFLSPESLDHPDLAFKLVTWLFQHVTWTEPFELMDKSESSTITWDGKKQSKIDWMKSAADINSIASTEVNGFQFIALPVNEKGLNALFVMPPKKQPKDSEDQLINILSDGIRSVLGRRFSKDVVLFLPKYKFDYEFEKADPAAQASGRHRAALDINETGARVAAASDMDQFDGIIEDPELYINRPFYFAMVTQQNQSEPRVVGMAYINQPWND